MPCGVGRALVVVWLFCGFTRAVDASQVLRGHVPLEVSRTKSLAHLAPEKRIKLAIGLPLRNQAALDELLKNLYDPANPAYHQYLSAPEFAARFGPAEADYQAVADFFGKHGFTVTATHPNRTLLDVEASVGDIEKTLHVQLNLYPHPKEARTFFAPDSEPAVDLDVPLLQISGLDNLVIPRPASLHLQPPHTGQAPAPAAGSGPGGSYLGKDFRAAYAPNLGLTGAGQYVGLLQFDGYYAGDISSYVALAGLTNVPLINVLLNGVSGPGYRNGNLHGPRLARDYGLRRIRSQRHPEPHGHR
jgi:subtilase family serine protease